MRLYVTMTSPYARMARIVVIEKGLQDRVEIIPARTREAGSPYYAINPSGRVPFLERDDGSTMEDSALICAYFDSLDGKPQLHPAPEADGWRYGRLHATARSFTDGVSVWGREMRRPENERSPTILAHEIARAGRLADHWEKVITDPLMQGPLNMAQLALLAGLDYAVHSGMGRFSDVRPQLAAWHARLHAIASIAQTHP